MKVKSDKVLRMLAGAGAEVDERTQVALIPESMVREAPRTVPEEMRGTIMTITIAKDNVE